MSKYVANGGDRYDMIKDESIGTNCLGEWTYLWKNFTKFTFSKYFV